MSDERPTIVEHIHALIEKAREPLGLDRWQISVVAGTLDADDAKASCEAAPEYMSARLTFAVDKLETGDELDELVLHELAHCHTWEPHTLSEVYANAAADNLKKGQREAVRRTLAEAARVAGERCTTQVGFTYIRLLRRAWKAEAEIDKLRAEIKRLKRGTLPEA